MTDGPTRLIHSDPGFARLAAAGSAEQPSSEQLDKALALADAAASRRSLGWPGGLGTRAVIALAVVGMAGIGIATMREERSSSDGEVQVAALAVVAAPPVPMPTGEITAPTISVNDLGDAPLAKASADRRPATRGSTRLPANQRIESPPALASADPGIGRGTFREELALVSAARSSIETGDVAACMRAVDRYDERFRAGIFAHEIEVLRIEALATSGDRAQARSRAEKFLTVNATSPYAERVRALVGALREHNEN